MDKYKDTLYVLYGSRTGNAKAVAVLAHEYAKSLGYATVLGDMQDLYDNETLHGKDMEKQKEWNFLISHKLNN